MQKLGHMPKRKKVPSRAKLKPKATAPAYSLDDHWVSKGDLPLDPTADPRLRHRRPQEVFTLSPAEVALSLMAFGWPVTADRSRRLSDAEVEERVERYRSKATSKDVTNLLVARVGFARAYARRNAKKPRASQSLLILEAENAAVSAMTGAYLKQSREQVARSEKGASKSVEERQDKAIKWKKPVRDELKEALCRDKIKRVHRTAGEHTIAICYALKEKKVRLPKEGTVRQYIQTERKLITLEIGDIEPG